MWQAIISYLIVALAALWLVWHLFVPTSLRQRLRPGTPAGHGCGSDGCGDCPSGCGPQEQSVVIRPARNSGTPPGRGRRS